jgi:hypothetical protein
MSLRTDPCMLEMSGVSQVRYVGFVILCFGLVRSVQVGVIGDTLLEVGSQVTHVDNSITFDMSSKSHMHWE